MKYIADLHIHSKYAGACSDALTLENINQTAIQKGINIIGTGDFTHPNWYSEIKSKLEYDNGVYKLKGANSVNFILSSEVCTIFNDGKGFKKIHNCILAPDLGAVEGINDAIKGFGDLRSDGRPILSVRLSEFAEILHGIDKKIFLYPAHCVLPEEIVMTNPDIKEIQNVNIGDKVFTHKGEIRKVEKVMKREYSGDILRIVPWYLGNGIRVTSEHPFLAIKTVKNCNGGGGPCKPTNSHIRNCYKHSYENYKPEWIQAEKLEVGDVLLYPRFIKDEDKEMLNTSDFLTHDPSINLDIKVDLNFCKLVGYYLAEGYTNGRDGIGFSFHKNKEVEYVEEVKFLLKKVFGIEPKKGKTEGDIMLYSRKIMNLFESLFYCSPIKRAAYKCMPQWMLSISRSKQVELFRRWWRGDKGSTSSRLLSNQMKIICLRLGILPSIYIDTIQKHDKRGGHNIGKRKIKARNNNYVFTRLVFFGDKFGLLKDKEFDRCVSKTDIRHGWLDKEFAYLPIRKINHERYSGMVYNLEVERDHSFLTESACVHNCWTPWYGVFGSYGFNSLKEAYEDQAIHIHAVETGLSSDPGMNWRISALDKHTLISGSDAHSLPKLGREAVVFHSEDKPSYESLIRNLLEKKIDSTVEFYPEEGKYHFDGHRNCKISLSPEAAKKYNGICPVCRRKLTMGVLHRIEQLADREEGFVPKGAVPYVNMVPLQEIIAYLSRKGVSSEYVRNTYDKLIKTFGNEFQVLLSSSIDEISKVDKDLALAIENVREKKVNVTPGYDGIFGVVDILNREAPKKNKGVQTSMSDFK